jgi:predicted negative regulator of RcsB-dependent stress response
VEEYLSEKEQWEWVKEQVRSSGPWIIVAVVLVFAGVGGWRWWQQRQDAARLEAGGRYLQILQALEHGDRTLALTVLGQLERDNPGSPYTDQARLLAARVYVDEGELDKAAGELTTVSAQSKDRELAMIARERLARVQIAQGKPDAALQTLGVADPGAFAARYHEARGDAYYAKGDQPAALGEYRSARTPGGNAPLLDLKIADLAAATPVSAQNSSADAAPVAVK